MAMMAQQQAVLVPPPPAQAKQAGTIELQPDKNLSSRFKYAYSTPM
jgi:hypothetical protein